jgi:heme exporter protein B
MASNIWPAAWAIASRDIAIEVRSRSAFFSALVFSLLAAGAFHFAFRPAGLDQWLLVSGVIWVIFVFSGILGMQRSFTLEMADRAIDGLLSSPVDRRAIFAGKLGANCIFVLCVQAVAVPAVMVFYNGNPGTWLLGLAGVMLLATLGLASVGTLFSSMAVNTRLAELLLPMLALPFFLPVVAMSAWATELMILGRPPGEFMPALKVLIAFDLVFVTASALVFPSTLED